MDELESGKTRTGSAFEALNRADAEMGASAHIEERLRADVRARAGRGQFRAGATFALAASLAVMIGGSAWLMRGGTPIDTPSAATDPVIESVTDFVPLDYNRTSSGPTHIVRLEVPRKALASFGLLPMDATGSPDSDMVLADVIVGDDGVARAVRFVRATSH